MTLLAGGCLSAVSPCLHQQNDPASICATCQASKDRYRASMQQAGAGASGLAGFVPFWMVYGIGCRHPTYQHSTEGDAIAEAERLAREHPGITFVVLSSIEAIRFRGIERVNLRDNIPF